MIPALSRSAADSGYEFIPDGNSWRLESGGQLLCRARAVPRPAFYEGQTAEGIPYAKIALLHGRDCLASTVIQECVRYNDIRTRCRFCAIGASLDRGATIRTKTPEQLSEVALAAKRMDHVTHVTLTAGTTANPDEGALYLGRCAQAIRDAAALPVEVQFEPLRDKRLYSRLKDMGVSDVGLHVESFDEKTRRKMAPGKAEVSLERYFEAFADAVAVFGRNKISTYVILGLGEDPKLTLEGCRRAISLGVYPVIVPLRPLLDSFLAKSRPVDPRYLATMYRAVGAMLEEQGLRAEESTAGCVRCRACSLLQFTEKEIQVGDNP
jgi:radical SAM protein (TIGR04043 family)